MNDFIVQKKEIYLRPRVIVFSINMLLAAPNSGVTSLSLDYPQALRHELWSIRAREVSTMMAREKVGVGKLMIWVRSSRYSKFKNLLDIH